MTKTWVKKRRKKDLTNLRCVYSVDKDKMILRSIFDWCLDRFPRQTSTGWIQSLLQRCFMSRTHSTLNFGTGVQALEPRGPNLIRKDSPYDGKVGKIPQLQEYTN